jgi:hypothetical protein
MNHTADNYIDRADESLKGAVTSVEETQEALHLAHAGVLALLAIARAVQGLTYELRVRKVQAPPKAPEPRYVIRRKSGGYLDRFGGVVEDVARAYRISRSGAELYVSENGDCVMEEAPRR